MSARVIIHACNARMWYVNEFLIPSLKEQGVEDITVWLDWREQGNLASWLECCEKLKDEPGGMWHLQDDVLISHDFGERINEHDKGIVCGFCHDLYETEGVEHVGYVFPFLMWQSSFPCIRIPNEVLRDFLEWYREAAQADENLQDYIRSGKCDDIIFRFFMIQRRSRDVVLNLAPHLVEHVDFLIGGSSINKWRGYAAMGAYFYDDYLVDKLIQDIAKRRASKTARFL